MLPTHLSHFIYQIALIEDTFAQSKFGKESVFDEEIRSFAFAEFVKKQADSEQFDAVKYELRGDEGKTYLTYLPSLRSFLHHEQGLIGRDYMGVEYSNCVPFNKHFCRINSQTNSDSVHVPDIEMSLLKREDNLKLDANKMYERGDAVLLRVKELCGQLANNLNEEYIKETDSLLDVIKHRYHYSRLLGDSWVNNFTPDKVRNGEIQVDITKLKGYTLFESIRVELSMEGHEKCIIQNIRKDNALTVEIGSLKSKVTYNRIWEPPFYKDSFTVLDKEQLSDFIDTSSTIKAYVESALYKQIRLGLPARAETVAQLGSSLTYRQYSNLILKPEFETDIGVDYFIAFNKYNHATFYNETLFETLEEIIATESRSVVPFDLRPFDPQPLISGLIHRGYDLDAELNTWSNECTDKHNFDEEMIAIKAKHIENRKGNIKSSELYGVYSASMLSNVLDSTIDDISYEHAPHDASVSPSEDDYQVMSL
jgi:hypothetical protein